MDPGSTGLQSGSRQESGGGFNRSFLSTGQQSMSVMFRYKKARPVPGFKGS